MMSTAVSSDLLSVTAERATITAPSVSTARNRASAKGRIGGESTTRNSYLDPRSLISAWKRVDINV